MKKNIKTGEPAERLRLVALRFVPLTDTACVQAADEAAAAGCR